MKCYTRVQQSGGMKWLTLLVKSTAWTNGVKSTICQRHEALRSSHSKSSTPALGFFGDKN